MRKVILVIALVIGMIATTQGQFTKSSRQEIYSGGLKYTISLIKYDDDKYIFHYRSAEYEHMVEYGAIQFNDKEDAIKFFDTANEMVQTKLAKGEVLTANLNGVSLYRTMGVRIRDNERSDLWAYLSKGQIKKILKALNKHV